MQLTRSHYINLFHILAIGPALLYLAQAKPEWMYSALLYSGIGISLYHLSKVYTMGLEQGWIYALHGLVFAPLLIYIGYTKGQTAIPQGFILSSIAFAAVGIHIQSLFRKLNQ